jgi:hypothetical protein
MHTLQLVGQFNDSQTSTGDAQAFVGNRTLVIEPTKLANDAVIAENGAS